MNDLADTVHELKEKSPIAVLASRTSRIMAFILDLVLIGSFTLMFLSTFIIPQKYPGTLAELKELSAQDDKFSNDIVAKMSPHLKDMLEISQTITILAFWFYFAISEILLKGSSIGKKIFSIRVVNQVTLAPPSAFDSIFRSGLKTFSLLAWFPFFMINFFLIFFTKKGQAGHDFLSRTIVIQSNPEIDTKNDKWD